jgi:hypothetical protein
MQITVAGKTYPGGIVTLLPVYVRRDIDTPSAPGLIDKEGGLAGACVGGFHWSKTQEANPVFGWNWGLAGPQGFLYCVPLSLAGLAALADSTDRVVNSNNDKNVCLKYIEFSHYGGGCTSPVGFLRIVHEYYLGS